jgi:signal transduction histidine kinase
MLRRWLPGVLFLIATVVLGLASELVAFEWDERGRWIPDLVVGWVFMGCGALAWWRLEKRGAGALMAATGAAWFLGGFSSSLLYLHRGPLVQLLLAYPGWRPRSRLDVVAVAAAYVAALVLPVWRSDVATIVLTVLLVGVAVYGYLRATGPLRRARLVTLRATAAVVAVLAGGAIARLAVPSGDAAEPTLLAYEAVLCGVCLYLLERLREQTAQMVADLVVDLETTRSGTLRDALGRALGDPGLEVGYWIEDSGAFVDHDGRRVAVPVPGSSRSATFLERDGRQVAVLVHDRSAVTDPALADALSSVTELAASHASLQAEVHEQVDELAKSSRRLLAAAGEERRRLEARLRDGPERSLGRLAEALDGAAARSPERSDDGLDGVREQLDLVLRELRELARGLHPRELTEQGLGPALATLAARSRVPTELRVIEGRFPQELEAACYFVCAEGLANVTKYASASRVEVRVALVDHWVTVDIADDGVGGANTTRGSGLRGLRDRVEALGGRLSVQSHPGRGTRLRAEFPLDGRPAPI